MKQPKTNPSDDALDQMIERMIDEHLAGNSEQLAPSSGFAVSVMESIETQAAEPPPIAFPWLRALPGLFALLCCLVVLVVALLRMSAGSSFAGTALDSSGQFANSMSHIMTAGEMTFSWIAVAALLSITAVAASFRLTGRRG
jgi:hypothetical protein